MVARWSGPAVLLTAECLMRRVRRSGGGARGDERAREKLNGGAEETGVAAQVRDARARQRRKAPLVLRRSSSTPSPSLA